MTYSKWILIFVLGTSVARADIALIRKSGDPCVVYWDGYNVQWKYCSPRLERPDRSCVPEGEKSLKGKLDFAAFVERQTRQRGVAENYRAVSSLNDVTVHIQRVQDQLERDVSLSQSERDGAQTFLISLKGIQSQLSKIKQQVFDRLSAANYLIVEESFQEPEFKLLYSGVCGEGGNQ